MGKVINILESYTKDKISLIEWSLRKSNHNKDSLTLSAKVNDKYYDFIEITDEGYFNILNVKDKECGMNLDQNNYPKFLISTKGDVMDSYDTDDEVSLDIYKVYEKLTSLSENLDKLDNAFDIFSSSVSERLKEMRGILINLKIIFRV